MCVRAKFHQLCPTLCDPMDHSLPGSSVHGILQVRKLEWVALPSSRGSFPPRDQTCVSTVLHWWVLNHQHHLGSPTYMCMYWQFYAQESKEATFEHKVKVKVKLLSPVQLFVTPWAVAYQAPPSMQFSRQE